MHVESSTWHRNIMDHHPRKAAGTDEAEKKTAMLKNMKEKAQTEVSLENLDELIKIVKE